MFWFDGLDIPFVAYHQTNLARRLRPEGNVPTNARTVPQRSVSDAMTTRGHNKNIICWSSLIQQANLGRRSRQARNIPTAAGKCPAIFLTVMATKGQGDNAVYPRSPDMAIWMAFALAKIRETSRQAQELSRNVPFRRQDHERTRGHVLFYTYPHTNLGMRLHPT